MCRLHPATKTVKSSPLRNVQVPSSPTFEFTPLASLPSMPLTMPSKGAKPAVSLTEIPSGLPLTWLWTCHICHATYSLGATRRCLQDGHYFCSGTTVDKRSGTAKRHASCSSEFDYAGWSAWQHWRRDVLPGAEERVVGHRNCWQQCDYPSECRWGDRVGVRRKKQQQEQQQQHDHRLNQLQQQQQQQQQQNKVNATKTTVRSGTPTLISTTPPRKPQLAVDLFFKKVKRSCLRSIKEVSEESPPTSPLKQHYQLPPSAESEQQAGPIKTGDPGATASDMPLLHSDAAAAAAAPVLHIDTALIDAETPETADIAEPKTASSDEESPATPDWIDDDDDSSETSSIESTSPVNEWQFRPSTAEIGMSTPSHASRHALTNNALNIIIDLAEGKADSLDIDDAADDKIFELEL
ncbi:MAG: hypothetical protein M1825_004892 [Sarcosagium campestre]|nr:MAG: hypothetical protein M1825_004892 [Sarcosagium campestre]